MSSQLPVADGSRQDAADDAYFAPLALARHMLLMAFKPDDGAPMNSAVRMAVDGDRAYFRTGHWEQLAVRREACMALHLGFTTGTLAILAACLP